MAFDDRNWGFKMLLKGLQQGAQNYTNSGFQKELLKDILKQRREELNRDSLRRLHQSEGTPPDLVEAMLAINDSSKQKSAFKEAGKDRGFIENVQNYFSPDKGYEVLYDEFQQPTGLRVGKQLVPVSELNPEIMQDLLMLDQQNKNDPNRSDYLSKLSNFGTGAATQSAGLRGDITNLPISALSSLSGMVAPTNQQEEAERWQDRIKGLSAREVSDLASEGSFNQLATPGQVQEKAEGILPNTENIRNRVGQAAEGTEAEKYVTPKNKQDKWWHDIGGTTALLIRPGKAIPKLVENSLKAAGLAVGGDLAGWLTEQSTGSQALGKGVKNATYIMGSLFPGLPSKMAGEGYQKFRDKVIDPALKQGKMVDLRSHKASFNEIGKKIDRFVDTSEAGQFLRNEAAKIEDMMSGSGKVNPEGLWTNIKEMNKYYNKIPAQSEGVFNEIIDFQKNALKKFSDTITPNGGSLLESANSLNALHHKIVSDFDFIKHASNVRNYGAGALFWLTGGFPLVMKTAIGAAGAKFASNMLGNAAVRENIAQLAKAGAAKNTALVNKLIKNLDSKTEKILNKMPKEDQTKIRNTLEKARPTQ